MQKTFNVYNDPGHGWAKVPLAVIAACGLTEEHFSSYSYRNGESLYLEEDCDMGIFAAAFQATTGESPVWKDHHANKSSRIRSYENVRSGPAFQAWKVQRGYA